jgi:hypothetical protein
VTSNNSDSRDFCARCAAKLPPRTRARLTSDRPLHAGHSSPELLLINSQSQQKTEFHTGRRLASGRFVMGASMCDTNLFRSQIWRTESSTSIRPRGHRCNLGKRYAIRAGELQTRTVSAQSQRTLVLNIILFDRTQRVPQIQPTCHSCANTDADKEKPPVGGQPDRGSANDRGGNHQRSRASDVYGHKTLPILKRVTLDPARNEGN